MNSYPIEFLAHPQPLMFVAGLGAVTPPASDSAVPMSPGVESTQLPSEGEFESLQSHLRNIFAEFSSSGHIWIPQAQRTNFRVLLVEKNVRLPLRKVLGPGTEEHSPLSPLSPSSPLYPDGLIAPVWIRKHAELVPSVFVLFLRLFETPPRESSASLGDEVLSSFEKDREREADDALVKEISERRQRLNERGIKLTVVLMASAATLDSPGLDARLSHLRRASQLSAKASLFVLTPVPPTELPDFVRSLHDALYDSAVEYYGAHGKRLRRKRGRGGGFKDGRGRSGSVSVQSKALGPQGWNVRYDFKAGWFAEIRGDMEAARRHYEDCWNELAKMFSSTTILPPRTKRWAEAKVLADCVASRICRLLMYENAGNRILVPYFVHLRRFGELCRGWGIGEETFEFWSWVARQYRLLGEVLDIGTQNGFVVPPLPVPSYPATTVPVLEAPLPTSSNNDMHILQPPAFYFYAAACCTIERKARLDAALNAESRGGTALTAAPGFSNEKKVDHAALIVELLTTAFNLLKDGGQEESGLALYVAYKSAQVHAQAGQHELALRFLDRLADKFAAENWIPVLSQLRKLEYLCSQATGNVETAARLLVEILSPTSGMEDREGLQDDLLSLLQTTVPSSNDPICLSLGDSAFVDVRAGFRIDKAPAGTPVLFQVSVSPPPSVDISKIEFAALRIGFSDNRPDITLTCGGDSRVDVGTVDVTGACEAKGKLKFDGTNLVVSGKVRGAGTVQISDATLLLSHGSWNLELRVIPKPLRMWTVGEKVFAPIKGIHPSVQFTPRSHRVTLTTDAPQVGFVGESIPLTISARADSVKLSLSVGLEDPEGATLSYGATTDAAIKDIPVSDSVVVYLSSHQPGSCVIDLLLTSGEGDDVGEITDRIVVPVLHPFECVPTITQSGRFATLSAVLRVPARSVIVENMEISPGDGMSLISSSISPIFPLRWDPSTSFALAARFAVAQRVITGGGIVITWRAGDSDDAASESVESTIPLPPMSSLAEAFVSCNLSSPAIVSSNVPFSLTLTISNTHPSDAAHVAVTGDTGDGFVWTGPRGCRVDVRAGDTVAIPFGIIPVGNPGWCALPHFVIWHGEGQDRREVRVALPTDRPAGTVLVLP